jgi:proteasome accessory factor B
MKKPRTAAPTAIPSTRPPLARMMHMHQSIQTGDYPNATQLAEELEVSTKSVYRDIDFMRDRLGMPVDFDPQRNGYYYTEEVGNFPTVTITEGEMFALLVAEKALQQYRGTTFEQPLISAFRKMSEGLPDTISLQLEDWNQTISFHTRAVPLLDLEVFDRIARAVSRREQLTIRYRKPGEARAEERLVDPYHLANINGEWFLYAFDHLRKDIRTFVPARIKAVTPTGKKFPKPQKFSLAKRLRDSFGVLSGHGDHKVVLQFNEFVADYVREKQWHESQTLKELSGGRVEMRLRLSSLVEIERWVLSWGGNVRVIQPPELVAGVQAAAQKILGTVKA